MNPYSLNRLYIEGQKLVTRSGSDWHTFLQFAAFHHKHSFYNQVVLFAQDRNATHVGTYEQWRDLTELRVKKGARPLSIYSSKFSPFTPPEISKTVTVFDIAHTYGKQEKRPNPFSLSHEQAVLLGHALDKPKNYELRALDARLLQSFMDLSDVVLADALQHFPDVDAKILSNRTLNGRLFYPSMLAMLRQQADGTVTNTMPDGFELIKDFHQDTRLFSAMGYLVTRLHRDALRIAEQNLRPEEYRHIIFHEANAAAEPDKESLAFALKPRENASILDVPATQSGQLYLMLPDETDSVTQLSVTPIPEAVPVQLPRVTPVTDEKTVLATHQSLTSTQEEKIDASPDSLFAGLPTEETSQHNENATLTETIPQPATESPIQPQPITKPDSLPARNFKLPQDFDQSGGQKTKYRQNVAAIKLLKQLETEGRVANSDEQLVLAGFAGWGGLPQAFDPRNSSWRKEYDELRILLVDKEYSDARKSTLNAHYTSIPVIDAMYLALERLGYQGGGNLLEPSLGIGNFLGRLPEEFTSSRLYGVELDSITGRLARQLYPEASIQITGFEKSTIPDASIDIAIGNVPFGEYTLFDPKFRKQKFFIHDYFLAKTLDKLRPGGIMAYITSSGTLDKANTSCREYIAQRAELLGAIRLPNNAFKGNAGTEVTTDIVFFQKLQEPRSDLSDLPWLHSVYSPEHEVYVNQYFLDHSEMLLGTLTTTTDMYGGARNTLLPFGDDRPLAWRLQQVISHLPEAIYTPPALQPGLEAGSTAGAIPADLSVKNGGYALHDDLIYQRRNSIMTPLGNQSNTGAQRIRGLTEVKVVMRRLIEAQLRDCDEAELMSLQQELSRVYDAFVAKHGFINSRANQTAYIEDADIYLLSSLEVPDSANSKIFHKGDFFTKRTIRQTRPVENVDTAAEALLVSMHETGGVDPDLMSRLLSKPNEEILEELSVAGAIYLIPGSIDDGATGEWQVASAYLSGNVRAKLREAEAAAEADPSFSFNVTALKQVIPQDIEPQDIDVRLGAAWLPKEIIQEFTSALLLLPPNDVKALYNGHSAEWMLEVNQRSLVAAKVLNERTYGTEDFTAIKLIDLALNQKVPRVTQENADGSRSVDLEATEAAKEKQEQIKEKFRSWLWLSPQRSEEVSRLYNELFNSLVLQEHDGSFLQLQGIAPDITLRKHQLDAIARVLYGGQNTLLAHSVGAGKTFEIVASAMELRRIGLAQKPMIVVPNHLVEQWGAEFLRLYPTANILVATREDFEKTRRQRLFAKIATGDWDAVIIGHTSFGRLAPAPEKQARFIQDELEEINEEFLIDGIAESGLEKKKVKQLEKERASLEARLEKMLATPKDEGVSFDELGIDYLFVDEAHEFKNLALRTRQSNVAGIQTTGSQKASDLLLKIRLISEGSSSPKVVFATGTPISNSVCEMYTMLRYLHYDRLKELGLHTFDAWASVFGEMVTAYEITPEGGGFRQKTRFAKFHNVPELLQLFREIADVKTAEMLDLPRPTLQGGAVQVIAAEASPELKEFVESLVTRAEALRNTRIDPGVDNMLMVTNDGRKAALDLRLVNPDAPDLPGSKVNLAVANIFRIWEETIPDRLTQMVFCDLSTPNNDGSFSVYEDIKSKLLQRSVPAREVAFIHDAKSDEDREALFERVRQGDLRILIGSTAKMGTGTNAQRRLYALHHLDVPWKPAEIEQREGRILRQGNINPEVAIFRYVTEGSFDAYSYQVVETKAKFIAPIMFGGSTVRTMEDVDDLVLTYAEVKAIASGNPLIIERLEVDKEVGRLEMLHRHFQDNIRSAKAEIEHAPQLIASLEEKIARLQADLALVESRKGTGEGFGIVIDGITHDERTKAGEALQALILAASYDNRDFTQNPLPLGILYGIDFLAVRPDLIEFRGASVRRISISTDPVGSIRSLEYALQGGLKRDIEDSQEQLSRYRNESAQLTEEASRPFEHLDKLRILKERQRELHAALDLDNAERTQEAHRAMKPVVVQSLELKSSGSPEVIAELREKVQLEVKGIFASSGKVKALLANAAKFNDMSMENLVLLALQAPDALRPETMQAWTESYHRELNEDAVGISLIYEGGLKTVYDVSHTKGRPLVAQPSPAVKTESFEHFLETLQEVAPIPIVPQSLSATNQFVSGWYPGTKELSYNPEANPKLVLASLIDIIGNIKFNAQINTETFSMRERAVTQQQSKAQALLTGYLVRLHYGLDFEDIRFELRDYMLHSLQKRSDAELCDCLTEIIGDARGFIDEIETAWKSKRFWEAQLPSEHPGVSEEQYLGYEAKTTDARQTAEREDSIILDATQSGSVVQIHSQAVEPSPVTVEERKPAPSLREMALAAAEQGLSISRPLSVRPAHADRFIRPVEVEAERGKGPERGM